MKCTYHLALLLSLLAGCASTQEVPSVGQVRQVHEFPIQFSECFGFDAGEDYLLDSGPGSAPPGWEFRPTEDGRYLSYVALEALTCNRIATLTFERGPVNVVFETHSKVSPPGACIREGLDYMSVLHQLIISDDEIAQALREYGLPARHAAFEVSMEDGELKQQAWTWSIDGDVSNLVVTATGSFVPSAESVERMAWFNATALGFVDLTWVHNVPQVPLPIVQGQMGSEMLGGRTKDPFVTTGDFNLNSSAIGEITLLGGDFQCSELLSQ